VKFVLTKNLLKSDGLSVSLTCSCVSLPFFNICLNFRNPTVTREFGVLKCPSDVTVSKISKYLFAKTSFNAANNLFRNCTYPHAGVNVIEKKN